MPHSGICLLVLLATLLLYGFQAGDYFIFDSKYALESNQWIAIDGSSLEEWRIAAVSTAAGPLGRPLSNLSFAIDAVVFGEVSALWIKRVNALLHVATGALVFLLFRLLLRRSPVLGWTESLASAVALLAAVIWVLNPLHVSTVLYAVQRMTQLPALFVVAGLYSFFRLRSQWLVRSPSRQDYSQAYFAAFAFTLAAAFSKENGLLLPWLIAITELCLFRFRVNGGAMDLSYRRAVGCLLLLPLLLVVIVWVLAPDFILGPYALRDFSLVERLLTQIRVLLVYLGWFVAPLPGFLGFYHDDIAWSRSLLELPLLAALATWCVIAFLAWRWRNSVPLLAFALLWYLVAHAMESSVFALEMVFEHRNYLPMIGVSVLLASLVLEVQERWSLSAGLLGSLIGGVLISLLFLRSAYWTDELRLAEHHFTHHPESARTRIHLASVYQDAAIASSDPDRRQSFLAAARELAYRSYQADPESIEALVLLIHFDGNSSEPELAAPWLQQLQDATSRGSISVADINFLEFYNRCVLERDCPAPPIGQKVFLLTLADSYPSQPEVGYLAVDYCLKTADIDCARREAERLYSAHPDFREALEALYQVEALAGDNGGVLTRLQQLVKQDQARRLASRIRYEVAP